MYNLTDPEVFHPLVNQPRLPFKFHRRLFANPLPLWNHPSSSVISFFGMVYRGSLVFTSDIFSLNIQWHYYFRSSFWIISANYIKRATLKRRYPLFTVISITRDTYISIRGTFIVRFSWDIFDSIFFSMISRNHLEVPRNQIERRTSLLFFGYSEIISISFS